jgi:hypothetical protein
VLSPKEILGEPKEALPFGHDVLIEADHLASPLTAGSHPIIIVTDPLFNSLVAE